MAAIAVPIQRIDKTLDMPVRILAMLVLICVRQKLLF